MEAGELSGGNQQKVALAKWLQTDPRLLLLDEPTRGVDVGAKHEIYELMNQWTSRGIGIILITSEMPELLAMSDRIVVMHRGRVTSRLAARGGHGRPGARGGHGQADGESRDVNTSERSPLRAITASLGSPAGRALVALLLVLVLGVVFNADGAFFKLGTHRDMLRQSSVFGILACGMTLVIITGGIDLSVGSVLALVAVSFSLMTIHWDWSAWLAVPLCAGDRGGLRRRVRNARRSAAAPAVHRHAGHDGLRPGTGQMGQRRPEDFDRRAKRRRDVPLRGRARGVPSDRLPRSSATTCRW